MLVLHSHIPYVKRQGRWPFGEVWLFEAMAETYIPLLQSWLNLKDEGISAHVALGFSPTLIEQLSSEYIQNEFISYLIEREKKAAEDERYFLSAGEKYLAKAASYYHRYYRDIRRDFITDFDRNIINIAQQLQQDGIIEIITTAATHAYLPLLNTTSLKYQVVWGKKIYERYFNKEPEGFWLPECGYFQGIEDILIDNGFKYFYVDSHAIEGGKPLEVFSQGAEEAEMEIETFASTGLSTYRPYRIKDKDINVFGRNAMVSHQVWSADYGYPGDVDYREFHKQAFRSGFKYWKVTDRNKAMDKKMVYDPGNADRKVKQHINHFIRSLESTGKEARNLGFSKPLIVGCYDTELFGHWWWEGVQWLEGIIKEINRSSELELILPSEIGKARHEAQVFESSWGMGGKHFVWENKETTWMWEIIQKASSEFEMLRLLPMDNDLGQRAVDQAFRELLLLQSSDWLFMVSNNLTRDYAMKRFFEHYTKFLRISNSLQNKQLDSVFGEWLSKAECEDDFTGCFSNGGVL